MRLYTVECINAARLHQKTVQYRVKWLGYPDKSNTWEPTVSFRNGNSDYLLTEWWARVEQDSGVKRKDLERLKTVAATKEHKDDQTRKSQCLTPPLAINANDVSRADQTSLNDDEESTDDGEEVLDADKNALARVRETLVNADNKFELAGLRRSKTLSPLSDLD